MLLSAGGSHCPWFQKKVHTHPMEHHWKFLGGGGVLKAKFLDEMYENKLEFSGERRAGGAHFQHDCLIFG